MRRFYVMAVLTASLLSTPASAGPSFDCRRASTAVEQAVCDNPEYAAFDLELAGLYQRALLNLDPRSPEARNLKDSQRAWIADRDDCGTIPRSDYRFDQCIGNAYGRRIGELRAMLEGDR